MILAILIAAVIVALGVGAIWRARRRAQTPTELRGDWWPQFERQFRSYAAQRGVARPRPLRNRPRR